MPLLAPTRRHHETPEDRLAAVWLRAAADRILRHADHRPMRGDV
jgi:hypothetical protein